MQPDPYIFHLALPVADLADARQFYVRWLGATVGRERTEWCDVMLWGHQLTLHQRPAEVLPADRQGKRHFGVVLPWNEWQELAERLEAGAVAFLRPPQVLREGQPQEQAKMYLQDPSYNVIEIKAYRDFRAAVSEP